MLLNFIFLELSLLKRKTQPSIMDHSYMQNRRETSVFSIKPVAASWKVFKDEEEDEEEEEEDDTAEEEEEDEVEETSSRAKKKRLMHLVGGAGGGSMTTMGKKVSTSTSNVGRNPLPPAAGFCQVEKCVADLSDSKRYHQRHKVCEYHSKAQVVIVAGLTQRFCQQCSRFHELSEFDDAKRSCRRRLAGHNERRRKHFSKSHGEVSATADHRSSASGSGSQLDKKQCRQADERGRNQIAV